MRSCLALVVPSVWPEPFGIVVLEALAAGRPVVGSSIGGIPEIVRDEREGLLVVPGDVRSLSAALDRLIHDDRLRDGMAAAAGVRAEDFSADAVLPRFEAAYADVRQTAAA
jgi:glycosyltransferase involved in cell wall biosynthesis